MEKTVGMIIEETKQNLVNTINQSGLPLSVLKYIVGDIHREIVEADVQQTRKEFQQYKEAQNQEVVSGEVEGTKPE